MKDILNYAEQQRFIEAIFLLKERKYIRSVSALCLKCGKNKSYLSDVRTKNVTISGDFIQKVMELYPINEDYILTGNGEILLSAGGGNIAHNGNVNNAAGGVQNVSNNCGHVVNETTLSPPEPSGQSFAEVLQQLVVTNAKLVETNAQLVAMLNISKNQ